MKGLERCAEGASVTSHLAKRGMCWCGSASRKRSRSPKIQQIGEVAPDPADTVDAVS